MGRPHELLLPPPFPALLMLVDEYRAAAAAAMTELLDDSAPVPTDEVMARFRASEAAEEDTTRRILALYFQFDRRRTLWKFCGWKFL